LYKTRMSTLIDNNMFTTNYGKSLAENMYQEEREKIRNLESILRKY